MPLSEGKNHGYFYAIFLIRLGVFRKYSRFMFYAYSAYKFSEAVQEAERTSHAIEGNGVIGLAKETDWRRQEFKRDNDQMVSSTSRRDDRRCRVPIRRESFEGVLRDGYRCHHEIGEINTIRGDKGGFVAIDE